MKSGGPKSMESSAGSLTSTTDMFDNSAKISASNGRPELKTIVFKLKNYFLIDAFSEEFIAYDGIRVLLNLIEITSGNTRVKNHLILNNNHIVICYKCF